MAEDQTQIPDYAIANAVTDVRSACAYVTRAHGGSGAVREVCDIVLAARSEP